MELAKVKKFLKDDDNYNHCSICGNYRNMNSYAHRKSVAHQKKLVVKLKKTSLHLSKKRKQTVAIHDEEWTEKDAKRFCHFCSISYSEHHVDDEFVIESLGSVYHYADPLHYDAVTSFLKRNFRMEESTKFCIVKEDLDRFLRKLPEAKCRYLKKMEIINQMVLRQIQESEEARQRIVHDELQSNSSMVSELDHSNQKYSYENVKRSSWLNKKNNNYGPKVPPWLEDVPTDSAASSSHSVLPVIGPTIETLVKHVTSQKKKGLSKKRIGADFKRHFQGSSKWLPSFQGIWNQGHRKQFRNQFNRRKKNF